MDKDGNLYLDDDSPEEDRKRVEAWGDEITEDELQKQREKIEEAQRKIEKVNG